MKKYLEKDNPYAPDGKTQLLVTRETKTMYFCKNNVGYEMKFRKPKKEINGWFVHPIHRSKFERPYTLVIKEGSND